MTRRAFIAGSAAVAGAGVVAAIGVGDRIGLPGRRRDCGPPGPRAPRSSTRVLRGTFHSTHVSYPVRYTIAVPPGVTTSRRSPGVCVPAWRKRFGGLGRRHASAAVRVDCGRSDSFAGAARQLLTVLDGHADGGLSEGCHNLDFRRRVAPEQVVFLARHLARSP